MFMYKIIRTILLFCLIGTNLFAQKSIRGTIRDASTDEALIGAVVLNTNNGKAVITNSYGYFLMPCSIESTTLIVSYLGYEPFKLTTIPKDTALTIKLMVKTNTIEDVTVSGNRAFKRQLGVHTLNSLDFKTTPVLLGEKDVLKTIQMLPGVQQNREGTSNFSVRGGSHDQNLILLDGIPVYNINHLFGFVSIFNTEATNKVTFYKGGIPARYGGRLSSVTDVVLREGNRNKYTGSVSLGLLSSKFIFEGSIQKGKSSFLISGRRSVYDLLYSSITYLSDKRMNGYYLQDYTAKLNYKLNSNNTIFLSAYAGNDKVYTTTNDTQYNSTEKYGLGWSNITSAFRWNNTSVKDLFSNVTVAYTYFKYLLYWEDKQKLNTGKTDYYFQGYSSGIKNFITRWDLSFYKFSNHQVNFGMEHIWHTFNPGIMEKESVFMGSDPFKNRLGVKSLGSETSWYVEDVLHYNRFNANIGLRYSLFRTDGKTYEGFQPRMSVELKLFDNVSLLGGYDRIYQYLHLVSNSSIGMPTDLWLPISRNIPPQLCDQFSGGFKIDISRTLAFTTEAYYKKMRNLTDYRDGIVISNQQNNWDEILAKGSGKSYGLEFMIAKTGERLSGWVNYTLSKSTRSFEDINYGITYPFQYDRRNVVNVLLNYKVASNKLLSASWVCSNGYWMNISYDNYYLNGQLVRNFKNRNNYQVPAYHHLDISYSISKSKKKGTRNWILGIYNVYGRNNYFSVQYRYEDEYKTQPKLIGMGMFPIIPYVSWEFIFK